MRFHRVRRLFVLLAMMGMARLYLASDCAAAPVSAFQARTAAANWLAANTRPLGARIGSRAGGVRAFAEEGGLVAYYVVMVSPSGFVIVSGDDMIEPIICFASVGSYDPSPSNPLHALVTKDLASRLALVRAASARSVDPALSERFSAARRKWARLLSAARISVASPAGITGISDERVSPIIQSRWFQETASGRACYNYFTPPGSPGDADNYPCGCVATAMAQLMRFHRYPTVGVGTKTFTIEVNGAEQSRPLRGGDGWGGPYDYMLMPLVPGFSTTLAQRQMIGALCHDAGVAVGMSYRTDGSAASLQRADVALTEVFKFGNAIFGHNSTAEIGAGLAGMINPNLDAGLPVLLAVHKGSTGHALVCDGYGYNSSTLYHHLNLGWAGTDDAWYNLPNVDAPSGAYDTVDQCVYNIFTTGTGEIISGRVIDNLNRPVADATVTAQRSAGGTFTTTTNSRGIYALTRVPSNSTYTVSVQKSDYTFTPRMAYTGRSQDDRNTSGNAWAVDFSGTYDKDITPPSCTVSAPASPTSTWPIPFSVTFSEPVRGFTLAGVEIMGASPVAITGSGASYTVTATPISTTQVTCRVLAGAARDAADNPNTASNTAVVQFQDPPPTVAITAPSAPCTRNCATLNIHGTAAENWYVKSVTWSNDRGGSGTCTGTAQWSATDIQLAPGPNVITVSATDGADQTGTASITVSYLESSPGAAWQGRAMVSLPVVPDSADPAPIVGFQGSGWYAYDPVIGYLGYSDSRSWFDPTSATRGRGFWAYFPPTGGLTPCGTIPPQDQPAVVFLKPGWNLIGQPFIAPVSWNSTAMKVRIGGVERPLGQATDAAASYAWGWDSATGAYYLVCDQPAYPDAVTQMRPWHAYWIRAYKECDLIIPPP